jgi:hypothetical protein
MDNELKLMVEDFKVEQIYKNSLFSVKSICEHLEIWNNYSDEEKFKLENFTARDSRLNKNFNYKGSYNSDYVYGEVTKKGVQTLIEKITKYKDIKESDVFADIGSGCGKLVLQMAVKTNFRNLVGIEIVDIRNKYAKSILEQISPIDDKKIFFINKDVRDFDLSICKVVFTNNLLFSSELNDLIYDRLPEGCHIISSASFNKCKFLKDSFNVDVSWSLDRGGVKMYYYIK